MENSDSDDRGFISAVAIARLSHYIVFHKMYDPLGLSVVNTTASGYILFTALILNIPVIWVLSKLVGYSPLAVLDIAKAGNCFSIFIAKIGCFLTGAVLEHLQTCPGSNISRYNRGSTPCPVIRKCLRADCRDRFHLSLEKQNRPRSGLSDFCLNLLSGAVSYVLSESNPDWRVLYRGCPFVFLALGFDSLCGLQPAQAVREVLNKGGCRSIYYAKLKRLLKYDQTPCITANGLLSFLCR